MDILELIRNCVVTGHATRKDIISPENKETLGVKELIQQALDEKVDINKILNEGLIQGINHVGEKFSAGEFFVPDMLMSAQAMKAGMKVLEPFLATGIIKRTGKVILGTVKGDMHDIGKNLVGLMLEGNGFEIIDLGIDTPIEKFVEAGESNPDAIIGMSALLTTTMENMRATIHALRNNRLTNKVIVGGAPITQHFADEIGADGYSKDAAGAVNMVKNL